MQTIPWPAIESLSDEMLALRVGELAKRERLVMVELLLALVEMERRRLPLALGYGSLFAYLTSGLGDSNGSAWRRMTAARPLSPLPRGAADLREGRLCLQGISHPEPVLTGGNHPAPLERAAGRSGP